MAQWEHVERAVCVYYYFFIPSSSVVGMMAGRDGGDVCGWVWWYVAALPLRGESGATCAKVLLPPPWAVGMALL